jgi:hypothetical protein
LILSIDHISQQISDLTAYRDNNEAGGFQVDHDWLDDDSMDHI